MLMITDENNVFLQTIQIIIVIIVVVVVVIIIMNAVLPGCSNYYKSFGPVDARYVVYTKTGNTSEQGCDKIADQFGNSQTVDKQYVAASSEIVKHRAF